MRIREAGRNLVIEIDTDLSITVNPIPSREGIRLFELYTRTAFGITESADELNNLATEIANLALGEHNIATAESLRADELTRVTNAAIMWQILGGGIELAQLAIDGDLKKAREQLMEANGMLGTFKQLQTLLNGVSELPTQSLDATQNTTTLNGSEKPSSGKPNRQDRRANLQE